MGAGGAGCQVPFSPRNGVGKFGTIRQSETPLRSVPEPGRSVNATRNRSGQGHTAAACRGHAAANEVAPGAQAKALTAIRKASLLPFRVVPSVDSWVELVIPTM